MNPALINNPDSVLFRCRSCCRGFHFHHLPALDDFTYDLTSDETERAKTRFHLYSAQWQCKECIRQEIKKPDLIVAWRPVDVDAYDPGTGVDDINEDEKEYLIKWEGRSYFQVVWMPGCAWVWGHSGTFFSKLFRQEESAHRSSLTETAIHGRSSCGSTLSWMSRPPTMSTRHYNGRPSTGCARINEVARALIKYKGLGYEDAVWESVPRPEDGDRWEDFVTAYSDWVLGRYITLPRPTGLKSKTDKLRKLRSLVAWKRRRSSQTR